MGGGHPKKETKKEKSPRETYGWVFFTKLLPAAPTGHEGRREHKVSMSLIPDDPPTLISLSLPDIPDQRSTDRTNDPQADLQVPWVACLVPSLEPLPNRPTILPCPWWTPLNSRFSRVSNLEPRTLQEALKPADADKSVAAALVMGHGMDAQQRAG